MNRNSSAIQQPAHYDRSGQLSRGSLHRNGAPKQRSKTYWDYNNAIDTNQKQSQTTKKTVLKDLQNQRNPFLMGAVSHDKYRLRGYSANANERLNGQWTIQRGNSKTRRDNYQDNSIRVKALPNIHKVGKSSNIVEEILREQQYIKKKDTILEGIAKMKDTGVLYSNHKVKISDMGKGGKITYTYNDYHSRITNPGYARTAHGTFFVR